MLTALRTYLVLFMLANAAGAAQFIFNTEALRGQYPILCNYLITFSILGHVGAIVAAVLLWRFRRLGLFGIVAATLGLLIINVYIGAALAYTLLGPMALALALALLWPFRGRFAHASSDDAESLAVPVA